jgi:hypothetical protein
MGMGPSSWYRPDSEYDVDMVTYLYASMAAQMAGILSA